MKKIIDMENVRLGIEAFDNSRMMLGLTLYEFYYVASIIRSSAEQQIIKNVSEENRPKVIENLRKRISEMELSQLKESCAELESAEA